MKKIIRKFIKEQIKALHESKKHVVKYSKSNNTYQVWLGDEIVTDFATKEKANAKAKNLNDLQNAKDVDKAQLKEAEVKGDVVNLHYKIDVHASPSDGDMGSVIDYVQNNEVVSKYGIKVEVGKLEYGPQEDESSVYVKFSLDRSKRGGTMTAIRLLREVVIEFIEKQIGAVAVDIEARDFKPDSPSDDEYDQMAQQSSMDDRRQQGMDPGLEETARDLGYLDEIGNFHDPRMSSGNFDHLTPKKEKQDSDVKSINMVYTDDGRFYGFNIYSMPGLSGNRNKLSSTEEVNQFLQSKGIKMEIPQGYDEDILDQIVNALRQQGIESQHNDYMDADEVDEGESKLKEMASELGYMNEDEQLSKLLQLSKHADVRDGEEKISKLAAAWDRWNYDNGDKYDDLVDHLFMAAELLGDGYRKEAQMRLKIFNKDVVKVMGGLSEEKRIISEEKSSLFSQSLVDDIEKEIREIIDILEDGYNENVEYREYKFKDGTGGFAFKWSHARNWGGRLGLSLSEDGNHTIETVSFYDRKVFNAKTKFKSVQTWEDLSDDDLSNIFRKLQPYLKKNEMLAKKALSDEASAQSDYYANKPDTGRIGYGLSQQPRKRN